MIENVQNEMNNLVQAISNGDNEAYDAAYQQFEENMLLELQKTQEYIDIGRAERREVILNYRAVLKEQCDSLKEAYENGSDTYETVNCAERLGIASVCAELDEMQTEMAADLNIGNAPEEEEQVHEGEEQIPEEEEQVHEGEEQIPEEEEQVNVCTGAHQYYNQEKEECDCESNQYLLVGGSCLEKAICGANQYLDTNNICQCSTGYTLRDGSCAVIPVCRENQNYNAANNVCDCNAGYKFSNDNLCVQENKGNNILIAGLAAAGVALAVGGTILCCKKDAIKAKWKARQNKKAKNNLQGRVFEGHDLDAMLADIHKNDPPETVDNQNTVISAQEMQIAEEISQASDKAQTNFGELKNEIKAQEKCEEIQEKSAESENKEPQNSNRSTIVIEDLDGGIPLPVRTVRESGGFGGRSSVDLGCEAPCLAALRACIH